MIYSIPKFTSISACLLAVWLTLPVFAQQRNRQGQGNVTDEQIMERAPEGVTVLPNIAYREGNEAWKLDLAMPEERGTNPRPAIVFIHGGGWRNGDKRANSFLNPTLEYAAKGYVCITVNYRMLNEAPINACVEDVKNAVRWLRAHAEKYNVDPKRIGAAGNSAGAHLSLMLGVCPASAGLEGDGPYQEYSSAVQAVAASATPTSFIIPMSERQRQQQGQADRSNRRAVQPNAIQLESNELKSKVSPMSYISDNVPPILLFHEISDRTVGVYQSDNFIAALREAGANDINYILLGDKTGHGAFQRNIAFTEPVREAFFNRILKPNP